MSNNNFWYTLPTGELWASGSYGSLKEFVKSLESPHNGDTPLPPTPKGGRIESDCYGDYAEEYGLSFIWE